MGLERCFLCSVRRDSKTTMHRFPRDPLTRLRWIRFCGLNEATDDVSKLYLCSSHFALSSYVEPRAKELGSVLKLKPYSVPTILKRETKERQENSKTSEVLDPCEGTSKSFQDSSELTIVDESQQTPKNRYQLVQESSEPVIVDESQRTPKRTYQLVQESSEPVIVDEGQRTPKRTYQLVQESSEPVIMDEGQRTPKRTYHEPRYFGDIQVQDFATPRRAKRSLCMVNTKMKQLKSQVKTLQKKNKRLLRQVHTLKDLLGHLKDKNLISEDCQDNLVDGLPEILKELINRRNNKKIQKYPAALRKFAITLKFYSTAAYKYVRDVWKNLLPHPSSISDWCKVVDGKPGFTRESFEAIRLKNKDQPVFLNLVLDEMSIKKQMTFKNDMFYGGIDLGTGIAVTDDENAKEASIALVFMAVGINVHWKIPIGYFLIEGLNGVERANLLKSALELIHDTGAQIHSITFDEASANLAMCRHLGANFNYFSSNFQPWFSNPCTDKKVFIFWDPCHMLKLVRNTLGDQKILIDFEGNEIRWSFIENLLEIQENEGLHVGTKLTKKHIHFNDNRMNVKLAAQTLSERVYNAFQLLEELRIPQFQGSMPTGQFAFIFNNVFDLLNCRNKFAKHAKFNIPITDESFDFLQEHAEKFEKYIAALKTSSGQLILHSQRKTGFLGLIICLRNVFALYKQLKEDGLKYLLTFKLSQDFIGTFFSAVRRRGGFNNNPNAFQFQTAYKTLLIKQEISASENSNCLADSLEILHVTAKKQNFVNPVIEEKCPVSAFDHDYVETLWTLTPYVENVTKYITGFVVKKIVNKKSMCQTCADLLVDKTGLDVPPMIKIKSRGKYLFPSAEAIRICLIAERVFRQNLTSLFSKKNIKEFLVVQVLRSIDNPFDCDQMNRHISSQDILDNHRSQLTKLIINIFLKIRLFHEAKTRSQKIENIRQKYTKLILFKNQ